MRNFMGSGFLLLLLVIVLSANPVHVHGDLDCPKEIVKLRPCFSYLDNTGDLNAQCCMAASFVLKDAPTPQTEQQLCDCFRGLAVQHVISPARIDLLGQICLLISLPTSHDVYRSVCYNYLQNSIEEEFSGGAMERSRIMLRFADLIEKHNDELTALKTRDNGKPYEQATKAK
ncbi:uncharacterized protein LOC125370185 [Ricinus communis]|uniref:uncharacterized protein LOC125370185 n=1 Tax=Ricinus communis TaxID=3988 RepID=UPI00201A9F0D|nr:uncharacterized protein LOC125370185 [Ricinus communis]